MLEKIGLKRVQPVKADRRFS